jgi:hypothetical protein
MKMKMGRMGLIGLMGLMMLVGVAWAQVEPSPAPTMPREVTLTSGRVLRNVQVLRWEKERVVLKHSGGADPIHFSIIKSLSREELEGIRESHQASADKPAAPAAQIRVTGQVFVTTRGAGSYKFSGAHVRAFSAAEVEQIRERQANKLPMNFRRMMPDEQDNAAANAWVDVLAECREIARATTDAEGNYELTLPPGEHVIACFAGRVISTRIREQNAWVVPVPLAGGRLDLHSGNSWVQPE